MFATVGETVEGSIYTYDVRMKGEGDLRIAQFGGRTVLMGCMKCGEG